MNHFRFHVTDTEATSAALVEAGADKPAERFTDRPFAEYRAMDPEGNWFDLSAHGFGGPLPRPPPTRPDRYRSLPTRARPPPGTGPIG